VPLALSDICRFLGVRAADRGELDGVLLEGMARLDLAGHRELSFYARELHGEYNSVPRTACAVLTEQSAEIAGSPLIIEVPNLALACARAGIWLPVRRAVCREGKLHPSAQISPYARVAGSVSVGEGSKISSGVLVGEGVDVGGFCDIGSNAVLCDGVKIGNRVSIGCGAVIGERGFNFVDDAGTWCRVPNFCSVVIEDDVTVLACTVIHSGVFSDTRIGRGVAIDSHVLIGHDTKVGPQTVIAGHTAVAGSVRIGKDCKIGGKVGINEGVEIANGVTVTAMSMVSRSILESHSRYSSGWPAISSKEWWRQVAKLKKLVQ
jgi:UDP-3-O-[3-hydroxymyristoyl] glucosamine N-acyltransferase